MPDPRVEALTSLVARVEGAACWLAGLATRAAMVGALAGVVLWWFIAGERVTEWWQGTGGSLLVLGLCLAPALWLVNVRTVLVELVELPETLTGVATRRARVFGKRPPSSKPQGGLLATVRSVRGVARDYGDVVGSWGTVAQLLAPAFWFLTLAALATVGLLCVLAAVAALLGSG